MSLLDKSMQRRSLCAKSEGPHSVTHISFLWFAQSRRVDVGLWSTQTIYIYSYMYRASRPTLISMVQNERVAHKRPSCKWNLFWFVVRVHPTHHSWRCPAPNSIRLGAVVANYGHTFFSGSATTGVTHHSHIPVGPNGVRHKDDLVWRI